MPAHRLPVSVSHLPRGTPPAAAALPLEPADDTDLDTRISRVEQRLTAREQQLRAQVQGLGARSRQVGASRALLLKLAGAGLAGAGLVWALRRGGRLSVSPALRAPVAPAAAPAAEPAADGLAAAATELGLALPLVQQLVAGRTTSAGASPGDRRAPAPVAHLDLARYAGTRHEQARLPQPFGAFCAGQPRAISTPRVGLLGARNACRSADGRLRATAGVARVAPGSGGGRLEVTCMPAWLRWLPLVWADLWMLHVDNNAADDRLAIAGHPSRQGLWLLSRSPQLPADDLQRLVGLASDMGFGTSRLVKVGPPTTHH